MFLSVITGDIIQSTKVNPKAWLPLLEESLSKYAINSKSWEIYRGDSFQLEVDLDNLFKALFEIKSSIKTQTILDVRMAVGVGERTHTGKSITTSNGSAYVFSGVMFDGLKKQSLGIKTSWEDLDEQLNLILNLAMLQVEKWNINLSTTVLFMLNNPTLTQIEAATILRKNQAQLSRELKRAGYEEILKTIYYCTKILKERCLHLS